MRGVPPQRLTVPDVEEIGLNACLCQALREVLCRVRSFLHTSQEVLRGSDLGDPMGAAGPQRFPLLTVEGRLPRAQVSDLGQKGERRWMGGELSEMCVSFILVREQET